MTAWIMSAIPSKSVVSPQPAPRQVRLGGQQPPRIVDDPDAELRVAVRELVEQCRSDHAGLALDDEARQPSLVDEQLRLAGTAGQGTALPSTS
jgi:hypothetical protein